MKKTISITNSNHEENIMKETIGTTIIDVSDLFSQDNNVSKSPEAIDSLTQTETEQSKVAGFRNSEWKGIVSLYPKAYSQKPENSEGSKISFGICQRENRKVVTATELKDLILKGHPVAPASYGKNEDGKDSRVARDAEALNFFLLDFDNKFGSGKNAPPLYTKEGVYLEKILDRFKLVGITPNIIHESASSKEGQRKYHVVIFPKNPYEDLEKASRLLKSFKKVFGSLIDSSGLDIVHFFYGANPNKSDSLISFKPNARMSTRQENFVFDIARQTEEAQRIHDAKILEAENKENNSYKMDVTEAEEESLDNMQGELQTLYNSSDIQLKKIETCLKLLPESFVHSSEEWFTVTQALKFEAETRPEISQEIEGLWDTWSKTSGSYNRKQNFARWNSLTRTESAITLGSIIKNYLGGWFGVRESLHNFFPEIKQQAAEIYSKYDAVSNKKKHVTKQKHEESVPKWKKDGIAISTKVKSYFDEEITNKGARYNLHTENIEMGDRKFSLEELFFHICEELNSNIPDNIFRKSLDIFLSDESRKYHPFDDYIRSLAPASNEVITEERIEWAKSVISEKLMQEVMSLDVTDDRFDTYQTLITTWLSGFVNRSLNPGCKFDHVLVLYGSQSIGKTTFFQSLVSPDYFLSHAGSVTDKDSKMAFGRNKLIEMGEISSTFRKSDQETLKNYITTQIDQYRVPYSAKVQSFPRRFALCASTNDEHFLSDATGNRRYFVIPVEQRINVDRVPEILDDLYTAIQVLMLAGEARSYLTAIQLELLNKVNSDYTDLYEGDLLEEILNSDKRHRDFDPNRFSINDLLRVIHEYYPHASRNLIKQKLAATIKAMGYTNKRVRIDGSMKRIWVRDLTEQTMEDNQDGQVDTTIDESNAEYLTMKQDLIKYHSDKGNDSIVEIYQKHPMSASKDKKKLKRDWDRLQSEINTK